MKDLINKIAWAVVMSAALFMSAVSLYGVARHVGFPIFAAVFTSTVFDGAAVLAGYYALKAAKAGELGSVPRLAMFVFTGASAYFNSMRAGINNLPIGAHILYAAPPIVALWVYELHARMERSKALSRNHRKLPSFGTLSWVLMPIKTFKTIRTIVLYRGIRILSDAEHEPNMRHPETVSADNQEVSGTIVEFPRGFGKYRAPSELVTNVSISEARAWARQTGYSVGDRGTLPLYVLDAYAAYLDSLGESESSS